MPRKAFYYMRGNMGYTSSCCFTRDRSRWIMFYADEGLPEMPYGCTKRGAYVAVRE